MTSWPVRFVVAATAILGFAPSALAENRMALVIGNASYRSLPRLLPPGNDSKTLSDLLRDAKFQVSWGVDVGQAPMRRAIRDFSAALAARGEDAVALVYFAGYGVQSEGENFLIPVDAAIEREADLPLESIRLSEVVNALAASPARTRIVIVDAARTNPFPQFGKSAARGLAMAEVPPGFMIAFAAAPGSEIPDGVQADSPFMAALVAAARTPELTLDEALKLVRVVVHEASEGRQVPWHSSRLAGGFSLFPGNAAQAAPASRARPAGQWRQELQPLTAAQAFEAVLSEDAIDGYEEFLRLFPQPPFGPHVGALLERRRQMTAWQNAVILNSPASYQAFLARYGGSDLAPTARRLLVRARTRMSALALQPAAGEPAAAAPPPAAADGKRTTAKKTTAAAPKAKAQRAAAKPQPAPQPAATQQTATPQPAPRSPFSINVGGIGIGVGRSR
jgi:uncharacterized caspase-like protein